MNDNFDVQEIHDGKITDMRIEVLLDTLFKNKHSEKDLNTLYTEIVDEFIYEGMPTINVSGLIENDNDNGGAMLLTLFGLDFSVISNKSNHWPIDGFSYKPNAVVAIAIHHSRDYDRLTMMTPGDNLNQAAFAALIQYARELSCDYYNQGELQLN